jgi:spore coat protein U-like protein
LEIFFVKTFAKTAVLLLGVFLSCNAFAASNCSVSATGINFGIYDVFSNIPMDSTGTITVTCTAPWPVVTIAVGPSANSGVFSPRKMKKTSGTDMLNYNLFTDSSMSVIWGDGTSGTQTVVHQPNKKTIPETVYGRIFPRQDITAGAYSETITATITW